MAEMDYVLSKDEMVQAIQGSKRAVTLGTRDTKVVPGQEIILGTEDGKNKAQTIIKSVTYMLFKDVKFEDALDNGFGNIEEFKRAFGSHADDDVITIVRF